MGSTLKSLNLKVRVRVEHPPRPMRTKWTRQSTRVFSIVTMRGAPAVASASGHGPHGALDAAPRSTH